MEYDKKCALLAKKIDEILKNGLDLSVDVLHYIDSTFSNPSIEELEKIIKDESNCEKDSLVELIFSPDEEIQIQLEDLLESEDFQKEDEEKVLKLLFLQQPETTIHFPDNRGSLKLAMPYSTAGQFISHLNISRKLDKRLVKAIERNRSVSVQKLIKVRLRNTRFEYTKAKIFFICSFFEKTKAEKSLFFKCLDFVLDFFDELRDDGNIFDALMDKKRFYFQNLQKAAKLEELIEKNNMEMLILQGIRAPYISKEDVLNKMEIIDRISLAVFGKVLNVARCAGELCRLCLKK